MIDYFNDIAFLNVYESSQVVMELDRGFPGYSLEIMLSGRMYFGINGGAREVLETPTLFWHHPDNTYQYGAVDSEGWHHLWVLMNGERARRIVEQGLMPLSRSGYIPLTYPRVIAEEMRKLINIIRGRGISYQSQAVAQLEMLLCKVEGEVVETSLPQQHRDEIEGLSLRIKNSPCHMYDFEEEAQRSALSYSHFRRLFKRFTGHAPHDYLLLCRMRFAADSLMQSAASISEIAHAMGYTDVAQFSKLFKQKIGLSPKLFRESCLMY
jgi:AraC-like DNA-binding protein